MIKGAAAASAAGCARGKRGVTLIELIAALAILGTTLAVVGLGVRGLASPPEAGVIGAMEAARQRAILTGAPAVFVLGDRSVRFAPDGSAVGGPIVTDSLVLHVDPLIGAVHASRR